MVGFAFLWVLELEWWIYVCFVLVLVVLGLCLDWVWCGLGLGFGWFTVWVFVVGCAVGMGVTPLGGWVVCGSFWCVLVLGINRLL